MPTPVRAAARAALGLALLVSCAAPPSHRVVQPVAWRDPQVDILHYDVEVELDHEAGFVRGVVDVHYRGLPGRVTDELVLDAVDLDVTGAWDGDDRPLDFVTADDTVTVRFPRPVLPGLEGVVRLRWSGFPRRGLVFVPPSGRAPGRPWHVWSQGQAEDTRHWMPVWDIPNDMATHELTVTLDASLRSMGAGTLVESTTHARTGTRTETWRADEPHVSYLITYVAGGFARGELDGDVPLPVLADPADLPLALENARHTAAMLDVLGELTGLPYPYPKYAQTFVHDFTAGGMENISATTLYYEGIHHAGDDPQIDITDLLTHELAHQWFGDLICGRGWKEIWLNEGLATFCEGEFRAHLEGPARRDAMVRRWHRTAMDAEDAASHPIVWDGYDDPDEVFDGHVYEGAAARLHLLRDQLGEEAFLAGLREYVARHRGRIVETADLRRAMEEASGRDLTRFFQEWFRRPGYPSVTGEPTPDGTALAVAQEAARPGWPAVFHAELEVAWSRGGVESRERVPLDGPTATVPLPGSGDLDWVRLDARGVLPGRVRTRQTQEAWVRQLIRAADPMTRLVAAEALDARTDAVIRWTAPEPALTDDTRAALRRAARDDAFPDVRVAALSALRGDADEASRVLFMDLVVDPDPRVRAAAVAALGRSPDDDAITVLRSAADDPNGTVALAAVQALVWNRDPGAWRTLRRRFDDSGPYQLRLQRDLVALAADTQHPDVLPFLVRVARTHPQRWVRAAAVDGLAAVEDPPGDRVFRQLCESLHDESYHVRVAAARALAARGDPRATRHLRARLDLEGTSFVVAELEAALDALG